MSDFDNEKLSKIDFDDENTVCPECDAYGIYLPPYVEVHDTIKANFKCNNGHFFSKTYPLKGESE